MPTRLSEVEAVPWREFLERQRDGWAQGQHVALVGPTGEAKSTFAGGLLRTRRWVGVLDPKGGDDTVDAFGYPRLTRWPLSRGDRRKMQEGEPFRFIVGAAGRAPKARAARRQLQRTVLEGMLTDGGWTVFADDLMTLADARFGGAADQVEELLILARGAKISVVSAWQSLAGGHSGSALKQASRQSTYMGMAYTRDVDAVEDMAQAMGRSRAEMRGAVDALGELPYGWLWVSRRPRDPILLTRPEKLTPPRPQR